MSTSVSAHRHDELLQAARIGIEPQRVLLELSLTPGIAVAGAIIDAIDIDGDGVLADDEKRAYIETAMKVMQLALDGQPLKADLLTATFPPLDAMRSGDSPIEVRITAALPSLSSGTHRVSFSNAHRPDIGVYLTNALAPEDDQITIIHQQRDREQRSTTIEYAIGSTSSAWLPAWLFAPAAGAWLLFRRRLLMI